jgi:hypothetical protein
MGFKQNSGAVIGHSNNNKGNWLEYRKMKSNFIENNFNQAGIIFLNNKIKFRIK